MRKIRRWPGAVKCALIAMAVGLAVFLPYLIITDGFFTLAEDYNQQQIPFLAAASEGIKSLPTGEWVWNLDLGSSLITGLGYYNLGSPFTWLAVPFPAAWIPYLAVWLTMLKYVTAAVTAYLWIRKFVKEETGAITGGLLYAFSGFQATNLLFHFHDAVAFFPLMLLGLDRLMEERKGLLFSLSVMINCMVNYVFFVQEAVFAVIYFLFRYAKKGYFSELLKSGLRVLTYAAVGVAMAAPLFLPNAIYLLNSPRGDNPLDWGKVLYDLRENLFILKGFLFPGEAMREQSAIFEDHFLSTSVYLPFFGMSFVIIFLAKNKGWLRRLIIFLILISFSPLIQAGFLLFTETFQRWWYMLSLLLALATAQVLDREQYQESKAVRLTGWYVGAVAAFCAVLWKAPWAPGGTLVIRRDLYFLFAGIALASSLLCCALVKLKWLNRRSALVLVMIASVVTTGVTIRVYRRAVLFDDTKRDYLIGLSLETMDDQYRYRESDNLYTLPGSGAGVGSFSSTKENSVYRFLQLFAEEDTFEVAEMNGNYLTKNISELPELLGGKYAVRFIPEGRILKGPMTFQGEEVWIEEREACPIGFAVDHFILREELEKYEVDQRAYVLMNAAVLETKDGVSYPEVSKDEMDLTDESSLIHRAVQQRVQNFQRDSGGFTCTTDFEQDQLVFFSVPNDAGWTARLDGEEVQIIDSCGMMVLNVPRGNHRIAFSYQTPGFRLGVGIAFVGWILLIVLGRIEQKRKDRHFRALQRDAG